MQAKIIIIIIGFCINSSVAQEETVTDSIPVFLTDSISGNKKERKFGQKIKQFGNWFRDETPKPKKALIMSLIVPGSGQVYNRRDWKVPIAYAGLGGLSYLVAFNTRKYKRFRTAYTYRNDDDPNTIEETETMGLENSALKNLRDRERKKVERSYMGLFGFYAVIACDAFVDAHLSDFNINDDLGLRIKPSMENQYGSNLPVTGLGIGLTIGKSRKIKMGTINIFEEKNELDLFHP